MPKLAMNVPHELGKDEAALRLRGLLDSIKAQYQDHVSDLEESWEDDTLRFRFKTFGFKVAGLVAVQDDLVVMNGDLPLSAMMFKGKIESEIRQQLMRLLA